MVIKIIRHFFSDKYVIGRLFVSDVYVCDTLEPALTSDHPCIPCGDYPIMLKPSAKFVRLMPTVCDVNGRNGILFHAGNTFRDTKGCILVGYNDAVGTLLNSRRAFDWLYACCHSSLSDSSPIVLRIKNK